MEKLKRNFTDFWTRSSLNQNEAAELILIIILWRYLTEKTLQSKTKWKDPGAAFHANYFEKVDFEERSAFFRKALSQWCIANPQLSSIMDSHRSNIESRVIDGAWRIAENLFSDSPTIIHCSFEQKATAFDRLSILIQDSIVASYEFFTPPDVIKLMVGLVKTKKKGISIYDPSCGTGDLLQESIREIHECNLAVGKTSNGFSYRFASIRLIVLEVPFQMKYVRQELEHTKFDIIISNPPFGLKTYNTDQRHTGEWSKLATSKSEAIVLTELLDHLSGQGTGAIILPQGFLGEKANTALRERMIEENVLDSVILLPRKIFYPVRVSTAILIVNKKKKEKGCRFIDASELGKTGRNRSQLSSKSISNLLAVYHNIGALPPEIPQVHVGLDELRKQTYDLQYHRYASQNNVEEQRSAMQVWEECKMLEAQLEAVQERIKEIMQ